MATAKLGVLSWALALGLTQLTLAAAARADADAPAMGTGGWHVQTTQPLAVKPAGHGSVRPAPTSSNVYVDPETGGEVYLPTGETIDEVVTVVAERVPAVASIDDDSSPASARGGFPWSLLVAVPVVLLATLASQKLWRGRRGRSPYRRARARFLGQVPAPRAGL